MQPVPLPYVALIPSPILNFEFSKIKNTQIFSTELKYPDQ